MRNAPLALLMAALLFPAARTLAQASSPRIAALMPDLAETLYSYGLRKEIVGVPEYTNLPEGLPEDAKPKSLGPYHRLNAEAVYALKPTLVLASADGNEPGVLRQLRSLGVEVRVFDVRAMDGTIAMLRELREIANRAKPGNKQANAAKLASFEAQMAGLEAAGQSPRKVFLQVGHDPIVTVSERTLLGEILKKMGVQNIFAGAKQAYPRPSIEEILSRDPDVIIVVNLGRSAKDAEEAVRAWGKFPSLAARRKKQIFIMQGDHIAKAGFGLLEGIRELKKIMGGAR